MSICVATHACMTRSQCVQLVTHRGCSPKVRLASNYSCSSVVACDEHVLHLESPGSSSRGSSRSESRDTSWCKGLGNSHGVGVCSIASARAELGAPDAGVPFVVQNQQQAPDVVILAPPAHHPAVSAQGHRPVEIRAYPNLKCKQQVPGMAPQCVRHELQVATSALQRQQRVVCAATSVRASSSQSTTATQPGKQHTSSGP